MKVQIETNNDQAFFGLSRGKQNKILKAIQAYQGSAAATAEVLHDMKLVAVLENIEDTGETLYVFIVEPYGMMYLRETEEGQFDYLHAFIPERKANRE